MSSQGDDNDYEVDTGSRQGSTSLGLPRTDSLAQDRFDESETTDESLKQERYNKRVQVLDTADSFDFEAASEATTKLDGGELDDLRKQAKHIMKNLYPEREVSPTLQDLVQTLLSNTTLEWKRGDWIEYQGNDMKWHLGQVRGVVRQAPDSFDWNDPANFGKEPDYTIFYNIAKETLLNDNSVRAPRKALQHMFGMRPWVWQQYALLKLERYVWFHADHERDFMEVDCQKLADDMWNEWIDSEENHEFRMLYDSYGPAQRSMLLNHLVTTFELLDDVTENQDAWEFNDQDMSLYTYLSVLGSGSLFVAFCALLQLAVPLILLFNALSNSDHFTFEYTPNGFEVSTTWNQFCKYLIPVEEFALEDEDENNRAFYNQILGKMMILAVISVYVLTVVPASVVKFFRSAGESATTYSRLNSLREIVWQQADDSFLQRLGYRIDRYMNTTYLVFLYCTILFILFNTDDVLDILLNALAAEFVHQIDEDIAQSDWYDDKRRWITAGACELVIQASLQLRVMDNPKEFCRRFDIDKNEYSLALGASDGSLPRIYQPSLAAIDDQDPSLLGREEALFQMCSSYALQKSNKDGIEQFQKPLANFSVFEVLLTYFKGRKSSSGMFDRMRGYRTWSRWNKIIFLARVPEAPVTLETLSKVPTRRSKIERFSLTPFQKFVLDIGAVLTGKRVISDVFRLLRKGLYMRIPFHLVDGGILWMAYIAQLAFPLTVLIGLFLIPVCY